MTGDEGQVRAKRDAAARARRLSLGVADDVTRNRMLAFAASLAEVDALEASMVAQSPPPVTEVQMRRSRPPAKPPKDDGSDDP